MIEAFINAAFLIWFVVREHLVVIFAVLLMALAGKIRRRPTTRRADAP